jgi:hypothetical protein
LGTICIDVGLRAVGDAAREELLDKEPAKGKRELFTRVVRDLLRAAPQDVGFALVCDREQDLAKEVAAWIERERHRDKMDGRPDVYERITGICYMNSRFTLQIQAADLVAGLFREHVERIDADPSAAIDPLLDKLTEGRMVVKQMRRSEFAAEDNA